VSQVELYWLTFALGCALYAWRKSWPRPWVVFVLVMLVAVALAVWLGLIGGGDVDTG
jgi:hypothetical protein